MTQFLLEEAAFVLLDHVETRMSNELLEEQERSARLTEMANRVLAR